MCLAGTRKLIEGSVSHHLTNISREFSGYTILLHSYLIITIIKVKFVVHNNGLHNFIFSQPRRALWFQLQKNSNLANCTCAHQDGRHVWAASTRLLNNSLILKIISVEIKYSCIFQKIFYFSSQNVVLGNRYFLVKNSTFLQVTELVSKVPRYYSIKNFAQFVHSGWIHKFAYFNKLHFVKASLVFGSCQGSLIHNSVY
jgi:hypothetical protein